MLSRNLYVYGLGLIVVAVSAVVFNQMAEHGWITRRAAEQLAVPFVWFLVLTLAHAVNDVLRAVCRDDARYGVSGFAVSAVFVAGFVALAATGVEPRFAATSGLMGGLCGVLAVWHVLMGSPPVAPYFERLETRMEEGEWA